MSEMKQEVNPKLGEVIDEACDICWYLGKTHKQKVREVGEGDILLLCKPCYLGLEVIER